MAKRKDAQDEAIGRVLDDLRRVFQVVHGYSKRAERVGGLTGPQLWAVKVLAESSPVRVSDLARRMYLHPSTVVGILDRLESGGLVLRTRSTEDRRVVTVSLTDKGNQLVAKTPEVAQGLLLTGLKALPNRELHTVETGLSLLVAVLGARELPPRLLFSDEVNTPGTGPLRRSKPGARKIP
jgi:DNA-binding MarR family transcriptional regulator